jgi:hypothetical protein
MSSWEDVTYRVSQTSGMVSVQADCTLAEALVLMKERAQVQHQRLTEIAPAVVERRTRFGV